jgi:Xaa-Pro aminopeptidase
MDYLGRQERLQQKLQEKKLDGFLVNHLPNICYLCGFTGSAGVLLLTPEGNRFFTDGRYREQAGAEVQGAQVIVAKGSALLAAAKALSRMRRATVGVEAGHMTLASHNFLKEALPSRIRLRPVNGFVEEQRMVKEPAEIERIRAAVQLASSLFEPLLTLVRPGVRESAIAAKLEYAARRAGAERMAFETIVAAGARSALPHWRASAQPVPQAGFVVLDFGVILAGYCSDMTRTVHVGRPTARARQRYRAVRQAQQAAIAAVRPGIAASQVDRAARSVLRRAGLASYFTHSTGHGVGLEIHEPPRLGKGQRDILRPGMVITIEPGIYLAGQGGVRIEDMVVVTDNGCEVLTPTSKELIAL